MQMRDMLRQSPFIVVYKKEGGEQDGNDHRLCGSYCFPE